MRKVNVTRLDSLEELDTLSGGAILSTSRGLMVYQGQFEIDYPCDNSHHRINMIGLLAQEEMPKQRIGRLYERDKCMVRRGALIINEDNFSVDLLNGSWPLTEEQEYKQLREVGL